MDKANLNRSEAQANSLESLVQKNIDAIKRIEEASVSQRKRSDVISDAIAGFCGSTAFIYVHLVWFGGWLVWNTLGAKSGRFDPPPFNGLTLVVSLEAIFLSTFILVSQNRQQKTADHRNHLDLQVNLLAEQETSLIIGMLKKVMDRLEIPLDDEMITSLEATTDPEKLASQIEKAIEPPAEDKA